MPINNENAADILLSVSVGMLGVTSILHTRTENRLLENQKALLAKQQAERKFYTRVIAGFGVTTALGAVNSMRLEKKIKNIENTASAENKACKDILAETQQNLISTRERLSAIEQQMNNMFAMANAGKDAYNAAAANIGGFDTKLNAFGSEVINQKQEQEAIRKELANIRAMLTIGGGNQQK